MTRKKQPEKPIRPENRVPYNFDSWSLKAKLDYYRDCEQLPIRKAYSKVYDFVNQCVKDPDFLHPDSAVLLRFMIGVRDSLAEGITEEWSMADLLHPIIEEFRPILKAEAADQALRIKNEKLEPAKDYAIRSWLSKRRSRGEKEGFCREIQAEVSKIAGRKPEQPIAIKTIRDNWLSEKTIAEWIQENK